MCLVLLVSILHRVQLLFNLQQPRMIRQKHSFSGHKLLLLKIIVLCALDLSRSNGM